MKTTSANKLKLSIILALVLTSSGCANKSASTHSGGYIKEPSGIGLTADGKGLWIVSDQGFLFQTNLKGEVMTHYRLGGDLEGVTYDASDNSLLVINEYAQTVSRYKLNQPLDEDHLNQDNSTQQQILPFNGRTGIEGITVCDSRIFVIQEDNPGQLIELNARFEKVATSPPLTFSGGDYSGLACDTNSEGEFNGKLWVVSDEADSLYLADFKSQSYQLIKSNLGFTQLEGVAWDHNSKRLYMVDDFEQILKVFDASDKANPKAISGLTIRL